MSDFLLDLASRARGLVSDVEPRRDIRFPIADTAMPDSGVLVESQAASISFAAKGNRLSPVDTGPSHTRAMPNTAPRVLRVSPVSGSPAPIQRLAGPPAVAPAIPLAECAEATTRQNNTPAETIAAPRPAATEFSALPKQHVDLRQPSPSPLRAEIVSANPMMETELAPLLQTAQARTVELFPAASIAHPMGPVLVSPTPPRATIDRDGEASTSNGAPIQVRIGRIEVRGPVQDKPPVQTNGPTAIGFGDYLAVRTYRKWSR